MMTNPETPEVLVDVEEPAVVSEENVVEAVDVEPAETTEEPEVVLEEADSADAPVEADVAEVEADATDVVAEEAAASEVVDAQDAVSEDVAAPEAQPEAVTEVVAQPEEGAVEGDAEPSETVDGEDEEPAVPTNPKWKWYVVNTYSGYENRAHQCLLDRIKAEGVEDMFGQILIPTENVVEVKQGAKKTKARKFFPGYMLVQMEMTTESWHLVKATQKITGFVGGTSRLPRPIREAEVLRITQQMTDGAERPRPTTTFEEGTQVRVTDGPFLNFTGSVEEVRPEKQKLRVLVSIFGRATPVELDFIQVERV